MLQRQRMEAETLAATQTREQDGEAAEPLSVTFAFPTIFAQARECFPEIIHSL